MQVYDASARDLQNGTSQAFLGNIAFPLLRGARFITFYGLLVLGLTWAILSAERVRRTRPG